MEESWSPSTHRTTDDNKSIVEVRRASSDRRLNKQERIERRKQLMEDMAQSEVQRRVRRGSMKAAANDEGNINLLLL